MAKKKPGTQMTVADPTGEWQHELQEFKHQWWWFLLLGVLLLIGGLVCLSSPFFASLTAVLMLAVVLMVSGIALIVSAFWTGDWSAFLIQLLLGILYGVVGMFMLESPLEATGAITLLVAAMFIVAGIFRMVAAIVIQFPQWGWALLAGALALILGIMIYREFPNSAMWLIGILLGLDLFFMGIMWIMISLDIKRVDIEDVTPE